MKQILYRTIVIALLVSIVQTGFSEYRIWTDKGGKQIEAELVRIIDDKVVLRKQDGDELKVSLDTLSKEDKKYAVLQAPPRVEIKVSTNADRENEGYGSGRHGGVQIQEETVSATVNIRKSSSPAYEAPMMSEVYLIGTPEQADMFVILDLTKSKFKFTTENKNEHSYQSDTISLKQLEAGKQKGTEYEGYIVIVRDRTGEILSMKCSRLLFEKNSETIIGSQKGDVFDSDFNPVESKAGKQAAAKGKKGSAKRLPGRRF
jgi:hypothetical protein